MDTHSPDQDDLSGVERLLSGWRPDAAGLNRDAMLFAAGLAVGKEGRGRLLWPALCGLLAVLTAASGMWGLKECAECQFLVSRLQERTRPAGLPPITSFAVAAVTSFRPSPDGYFNLRRRMEQDPSRWLASRESTGSAPPGPAPPEPAILKASQYEALFNQ
jgi:hypothetical protein